MVVEGSGAGSPVSGSSEGARGGVGEDCGEWAWRLLFMSLEPSVRQQDTPGLLRWVALLRTILSDETGERFSNLRHRKQVVRQLRVPFNPRMGRQSVITGDEATPSSNPDFDCWSGEKPASRAVHPPRGSKLKLPPIEQSTSKGASIS